MKVTEKEVTILGKKWTVIETDPEETVLCDLCNENYTESEERGGILFSSKAVCPKCLPEFMKSIQKYHEESFIVATAKDDESFRDFVYRMRKEGH